MPGTTLQILRLNWVAAAHLQRSPWALSLGGRGTHREMGSFCCPGLVATFCVYSGLETGCFCLPVSTQELFWPKFCFLKAVPEMHRCNQTHPNLTLGVW